jgi:ADP-ribose pyrophosphatase YjhB (NUDIX family)
MRVEVRAVIYDEGQIVTTSETRHGKRHRALPGGRVERWETVEEALIREVHEETGLLIEPGKLLYVAQVVSRFNLHDLNLVFAATIKKHGIDRYKLLDPTDPTIFPPLASHLSEGIAHDWPDSSYWLGNIFDVSKLAEH